MSQKERLSLVDFSEKLSVSSQCKLLRIPRSSLYYTPREETPYNLAVMRFLDEQYFKISYSPFSDHCGTKISFLLR